MNMKVESKKNILIVVLFVLLGILAYTNYQAKLNQRSIDAVKREMESKIEYYENENGRQVAKRAAAEGALKHLEENYREEIRLMRDEFGVKLRDLKTFIAAATQSSGSGKTTSSDTTVMIDSVYYKARHFSVQERWLDFRANLVGDEVYYQYTTRDSLAFTVSYNQPRFSLFSKDKRQLNIQATSFNPNTEITYLRSISPQLPPRKHFSVGIGLGYQPWPNNTVAPVVYIGYDFIQF